MNHWLVRFTRRGWEPPRPFGKTREVVCAETRDEAKRLVDASPCFKITASRTDKDVNWPHFCHCTWHVVASQGRVILGVFGSALLSDAQECAAKVEHETGLPAFVSQVKGERPSVGEVFTKEQVP